MQASEKNENTATTFDEYLLRKCALWNNQPGKLEGYDCPICQNRGNSLVIVNTGCGESTAVRECECMKIRIGQTRLDKSGLSDLVKRYTFENFRSDTDWRREIKDKALQYLSTPDGKWFFIGGQPGAGKTHVCTAITSEFLYRGRSVRYMLWKDESSRLKANINNDEKFIEMIEPLKTVDVLYIDDLFKTRANAEITAADVTLAFELLNFRYNKFGLITIISSEKVIDEILDIDEATGSRIFERTNKTEYGINLKRDKSKNYRLNE